MSKADFKCHTKKWIPYIKGGEARKWFGHLTFLVNWDNNGLEIRNEPKATVRNEQFFYREGITWSDVGTNSTTFRFFPSGCLRDNRGPAIFARMPFYVLGLLNSPVSQTAQRIVNPTICFQAGSAKAIPYIEGNSVQIQECTDLTAKTLIFPTTTGIRTKLHGISSGIRWCKVKNMARERFSYVRCIGKLDEIVRHDVTRLPSLDGKTTQ